MFVFAKYTITWWLAPTSKDQILDKRENICIYFSMYHINYNKAKEIGMNREIEVLVVIL